MSAIINHWPNWFRKLYGGAWPDTYCCVDTETTGFSHTEDMVTEWGHCYVENGKVVDRLSLVFDWTSRPTPPDHWLKGKLARLHEGFASRGKTCHMTYDLMRDKGLPPEEAYDFIRKFTAKLKARDVPFVLHNHNFDEKMLSANALRLGITDGFTFGPKLIDTAAIAKANQLTTNERCHPKKTDSLRDYWLRVAHTRVAGVKCNMDDYCYETYKFAEHGIRREDMHGAREDAFCCHLLMRAFAEGIKPPPAGHDDKDSVAVRRRVPAPTPDRPSNRIRGQRNT